MYKLSLLILAFISCSHANRLRGGSYNRGRRGVGKKVGLDKDRDSLTSDGIEAPNFDAPEILSNETVDIKATIAANLANNSTSPGPQARIVGGYRTRPQNSYVLFLVNQGTMQQSSHGTYDICSNLLLSHDITFLFDFLNHQRWIQVRRMCWKLGLELSCFDCCSLCCGS